MNFHLLSNIFRHIIIFISLISLIFISSCAKQTKTPTDDRITEQALVPETANNSKGNTTNQIGKYILCIFQDRNSNYWFASSGEGVYRYDGKALVQFTTKDGLSDDQVFTIQEDKQNNIWFVSAGGISRFDGKTFTTFPDKDNKQLLNGNDLKMDPDDLWFEVGGGAYRYNGNSFSYLLLHELDSDPNSNSNSNNFNPTDPQNPDSRKLNAYSVYCSLKDKKGNLWLGTQTMGVCCFDGNTFTWFTEKGLSGPAVRVIFEDRNGDFWFGNNGNGLFRYDGKTLINITEKKGLGNPEFVKTGKSQLGTLARVWTINEDNNGDIWIGTYDSGVWRYDGRDLTNYTTKDGLTSNAVNTIYKDKKGELWIGTDGEGVCKFNGKSFSGFTFKP